MTFEAQLEEEYAWEDTAVRQRMPARRGSITFEFEHKYPGADPRTFTAHAGYYGDGKIGEAFVSLVNGQAKLVTVDAHDACIALSYALQCGADLHAMSRAMLRGEDGRAHGLIGSLLDALISAEQETNA